MYMHILDDDYFEELEWESLILKTHPIFTKRSVPATEQIYTAAERGVS